MENNDNKQQKIVQMFNEIAGTYDTANRVLSMGIDIQWRKTACDETFARYTKPIDLIVDVACGTGYDGILGKASQKSRPRNR